MLGGVAFALGVVVGVVIGVILDFVVGATLGSGASHISERLDILSALFRIFDISRMAFSMLLPVDNDGTVVHGGFFSMDTKSNADCCR